VAGWQAAAVVSKGFAGYGNQRSFTAGNAAFISTRDDELQGGRNPKAQLAVVQADRPAGNVIHNLK
jgi:hypothetical protein